MVWNVFKEIKVCCNECQALVISKSDNEWTSCACGSTKVMGKKSFMRVQGTNYTDLSILDFSEVPEHRGWDMKSDGETKLEG